MDQNKLYAVAAVPVILFLISFFQNRALEHHAIISDHAEYLEVPDYIYSAEFRLIIEKTYLDLYKETITDSMRIEKTVWLGYCNEDTSAQSCSISSISDVKCGDKIRWGNKTFCIPW